MPGGLLTRCIQIRQLPGAPGIMMIWAECTLEVFQGRPSGISVVREEFCDAKIQQLYLAIVSDQLLVCAFKF